MEQYSVLLPTSDSVMLYNTADVGYPAANVVDTFGTIWVSKVQAQDLSALELASSGKLAFSPNNQHALDLRLEGSSSNTTFVARGERDLVLRSQSASNFVSVQSTGNNVFSSSACNLFAAKTSQVFSVMDKPVIEVHDASVSVSNLSVQGQDFRVPIGTTIERPSGPGIEGQIFYNLTNNRFEGFSSGAWSGLGGTVDVDQNTYVSAEDFPGANNDELKFFTAGTERMRITPSGLLGYGLSNPEYTLDIKGDIRVSGNIIANTASIGEKNGNTLLLGVDRTGSTDVVDSPETNNEAGIMVAGVPSHSLLVSDRKSRFEKSLKWNFGTAGMEDLGKKDAWDTESFWRLRGGSFRIANTNADTGAEVEYIMRISDTDEFQIVRHSQPRNGGAETYDVVAKFGNKMTQKKLSGVRGNVYLDLDRTTFDDSNNVLAYINSSNYEEYTIYVALYPVSMNPSASDVMSSASVSGYVSYPLAGSADNNVQHTFSTMYDGSAVPHALLKAAGVVQSIKSGHVSQEPIISYVLNDQFEYNDAVSTVLRDTQSSSTVELLFTYNDPTWITLSQVDKDIFRDWFKDQLVRGAQAKGITVASITITIESGSYTNSVVMSYLTKDTVSILNSVFDTQSSFSMLHDASSPIPFVDVEPVVLTENQLVVDVGEIKRLSTLPRVDLLEVVQSSQTSATMRYSVSEQSSINTISTLHVLVSDVALGSSVMPFTIKDDPRAQVFSISSLSGEVNVALTESQTAYVYMVAENDHADAHLSSIRYITIQQMLINVSQFPQLPSGERNIALQDTSSSAVKLKNGITFTCDTKTATVYYTAFKADDVPQSDIDLYNNVLTGTATAMVV